MTGSRRGSTMRRLMHTTAFATALAIAGTPASAQLLDADSPAEGAWYDTATPGQGLLLDALPGAGIVFAAWFTYAGDGSGAQRWYVAQLTPTGPVATGPLFRSTGGRLNQPPDGSQQEVEVGTLTLDFLDCATVRASYSIATAEETRSGQFTANAAALLTDPSFTCSKATKLRWPHAAPTLTDAEYEALAASVFIPNNYAVHQGGATERPDELYLHGGLDIVTNQGDPIYALEAGRVRSVASAGTNSGFTVTVESATKAGEGWSYVHIVPEVQLGGQVAAGQRMGTVQFQGTPHLHLSRVRQDTGSASWTYNELVNQDPTPWFVLPDPEPPLFRPQLLFFLDGTEQAFAQGAPTVVSGKVDIVAGIRDPGPHARFTFANGVAVGDRHNVAWVEYEIAGTGTVDGIFEHHRAFDFVNLGITSPTGSPWSMTPMAAVAFVPILQVPVPQSDRNFNYYRLTHGTTQRRLEVEQAGRAWDTAARHADGSRRYPDGSYRITVRAADWAGNIAQVQDHVEVDND